MHTLRTEAPAPVCDCSAIAEVMEQSLGTLLQCMSELRKSERFGRILLIILKIGNVRRCTQHQESTRVKVRSQMTVHSIMRPNMSQNVKTSSRAFREFGTSQIYAE